MEQRNAFFSVVFFLLIFPILTLYAENSNSQNSSETPGREEILFTKIRVVTASKKPQESAEAAAAISVISAARLRELGARTIAEAVQYIPGLNVFGLNNVNIRGVGSGGRILLLVDGRRNNDVFTGGFEVGFERSLDDVDRIEVIKGPASSLYGTNAFAGIINIITKDGADYPGIRLRAGGGNFTTQTYGLTYGLRNKTVDGFLAATAHSDEGPDLAGTNDSTRAFDLFGKLRWNDFIFSAGYRPNRTEIPAIGGFPSPESFTKRYDTFSQVQYQKQYEDRWNFHAQFYFQNEILFLNDPTEDLDITDLRLEGEARVNYTFNDQDNLTIGTELRRDRTKNERLQADEIYRSNNRSFYAENEYRMNPELILTTGIRFDDNSVFGSSTNPRVGLIFRPREPTILKFFAGRAFRGPEFVNLFTDLTLGNFIVHRNPLLKPEKVWTFEGEIMHSFSDSLQLRFNVYHNSLDDLIFTSVTGTTATFSNFGKASLYGIEAGANGQLFGNVFYFVNYALQKGRNITRDRDVFLLPTNTINGGITYRSTHGYTISLLNVYVGSRLAQNLVLGRIITLSDYLKTDLVFLLDLTSRLQLQTAVYNLFDADYESDFAAPQRGIQAVAGIRYRFQ
jgi:iron complex outermembrane receptor protein